MEQIGNGLNPLTIWFRTDGLPQPGRQNRNPFRFSGLQSWLTPSAQPSAQSYILV
jgi:hypothetical protein